MANPVGPFTVQWLNGHWFIGSPGAAQRIEDAAWLDAWLTANGSRGHGDLDFAGDREIEQRFLAELSETSGGNASQSPASDSIGEPE
jgi:hypothetical protein